MLSQEQLKVSLASVHTLLRWNAQEKLFFWKFEDEIKRKETEAAQEIYDKICKN